MEYKIGKPLKTPLVKQCKNVHRDLINKHLQIDCAMSVAAILKKNLLPVPLLVHGQSSTQKFLMLELASLKQDSYKLFLHLQEIMYANAI